MEKVYLNGKIIVKYYEKCKERIDPIIIEEYGKFTFSNFITTYIDEYGNEIQYFKSVLDEEFEDESDKYRYLVFIGRYEYKKGVFTLYIEKLLSVTSDTYNPIRIEDILPDFRFKRKDHDISSDINKFKEEIDNAVDMFSSNKFQNKGFNRFNRLNKYKSLLHSGVYSSLSNKIDMLYDMLLDVKKDLNENEFEGLLYVIMKDSKHFITTLKK